VERPDEGEEEEKVYGGLYRAERTLFPRIRARASLLIKIMVQLSVLVLLRSDGTQVIMGPVIARVVSFH
jgi:hypothetical protein